jgi:tRNA (pseudouridine54-N1)-methyltransferase
MITIIVKGNKARTAPDFLLKDLPGSGGRMDIMCRCLNAALLISHGIRENVEVLLCLEGPPNSPRCIQVRGDAVKYLSPDERSTAILLQKALKAYVEGEETESTPGIVVSGKAFLECIHERIESVVLLDEEGTDIRGMQLPADDVCFVLGDHLGFTQEEAEALSKAPLKVSVSPKILHASQCITLLLNELDRTTKP